MAEPMLFQRLVELQQIEIRLPLFEKPGFCGFHITSPPALSLRWTAGFLSQHVRALQV